MSASRESTCNINIRSGAYAGLASSLAVAGRVLLGGLFAVGGLRHFSILPMMTEMLRARGIPFPRAALLAGTIFQIVAGVTLMLGSLVTPAALGLILFTFAASVVALNFWDKEGEERTVAINGWLSNLAIVGGLMVVAAQGLRAA